MEHGRYACFEHEVVCYCLKRLAVNCMAFRLWLGHRGASGFGPLFKFNANSLAVDRGIVTIPSEALNTHRGDIAPKTTKAL